VKKKWIDSGKVKLIYRDFPLDQTAVKAAQLCRRARQGPLLRRGRHDLRQPRATWAGRFRSRSPSLPSPLARRACAGLSVGQRCARRCPSDLAEARDRIGSGRQVPGWAKINVDHGVLAVLARALGKAEAAFTAVWSSGKSRDQRSPAAVDPLFLQPPTRVREWAQSRQVKRVYIGHRSLGAEAHGPSAGWPTGRLAGVPPPPSAQGRGRRVPK